jgi:hypothetical protein
MTHILIGFAQWLLRGLMDGRSALAPSLWPIHRPWGSSMCAQHSVSGVPHRQGTRACPSLRDTTAV